MSKFKLAASCLWIATTIRGSGCGGDADRDPYDVAHEANTDRVRCVPFEWPIGGGYSSEDCADACTPRPDSVLPLPAGMVCPFGMTQDEGGRLVAVDGLIGVCIQQVIGSNIIVNWEPCACDGAVCKE